MKTFAIMIIWFGSGSSQTFDTQRYQTMEECEAAKQVILAYAEDSWSRGYLRSDLITCREVTP